MIHLTVALLSERLFDRVYRKDVRHVRPVGLVGPGLRRLAAVAPIQKDPARPPAAVVVPAEGAFVQKPGFATPAETAATDVAEGVFVRPAAAGQEGDARRITGLLGRVLRAGARCRDLGPRRGGDEDKDQTGAHRPTP